MRSDEDYLGKVRPTVLGGLETQYSFLERVLHTERNSTAFCKKALM